jgi:hypothetical protein
VRVWRVAGQRAFELRQVRAERSRGVGAGHARRGASASMRSSRDSCACVAYRTPPCRW